MTEYYVLMNWHANDIGMTGVFRSTFTCSNSNANAFMVLQPSPGARSVDVGNLDILDLGT